MNTKTIVRVSVISSKSVHDYNILEPKWHLAYGTTTAATDERCGSACDYNNDNARSVFIIVLSKLNVQKTVTTTRVAVDATPGETHALNKNLLQNHSPKNGRLSRPRYLAYYYYCYYYLYHHFYNYYCTLELCRLWESTVYENI